MTLEISQLSTTLRSINQNTDFSAVQKSVQEAVNNFTALKNTLLGGSVGEVRGGIQALTQEVDNAEDLTNGTIVPTVTRATQNVPGAGSELTGSVPSGDRSDIEAITGTAGAGANGFLQDIVTAASPEAINNALTSTVGVSTQQIQPALSSLSQLGDAVTPIIGKNPFSSFTSSAQIFNQQLGTAVGSNSQFFLLDLGEKLSRNFQTDVTGLVDDLPRQADIDTAFNLVSKGNYEEAFKSIQQYIELPANYEEIINSLPRAQWPQDVLDANLRLSNIESEFKTLSVELTSYSSQFDPSNRIIGVNTLGHREVTSSSNTDNSSEWDFGTIGSAEELESLFRSVTRSPGKEIAGAVIHWSATFLDQDIGSEWLDNVHKDRGFSGIGYHLVIRRDGTIQKGRPLNRSGAHDVNNNITFIGICFVGGCNEYSNRAREPFWKYASAKSFTPQQFNTYDKVMAVFHRVFPYAQVAGHYMTSNDGKVDPGFDVVDYSAAKFNHRNVVPENDPIWKDPTPITLDTIASYSA